MSALKKEELGFEELKLDMQECQAAGSFIINFGGEYPGKPIRECDKGWLVWCLKRYWIDSKPNFKTAAEKYLRYLDANPDKAIIKRWFGHYLDGYEPYDDMFDIGGDTSGISDDDGYDYDYDEYHYDDRNEDGEILDDAGNPFVYGLDFDCEREFDINDFDENSDFSESEFASSVPIVHPGRHLDGAKAEGSPLQATPVISIKAEVIETPKKRKWVSGPMSPEEDVKGAQLSGPATPSPRRSQRLAKKLRATLPETGQLPTPHPTPDKNAKELHSDEKDPPRTPQTRTPSSPRVLRRRN
ncbi:hypothetical protein CALVIDRAFT_106092 [Calocera viscosa TUFC12733]|uniref:Uncharacterized protein n=1 Tax=Calocera viscosa (strain TUFC12733) TaxID=1330018 RepID=A0A167MQZ3_CALVF|nr:hypothetical protein CALVIDRAFT_106092 [Calocera viscosa TUFC12733]